MTPETIIDLRHAATKASDALTSIANSVKRFVDLLERIEKFAMEKYGEDQERRS